MRLDEHHVGFYMADAVGHGMPAALLTMFLKQALVTKEITPKGYRLLEGYRGTLPADIPAVEDLLLRVARLVEEVPEISELDLNPVMVLRPGRGCQIIDARIRIGP